MIDPSLIQLLGLMASLLWVLHRLLQLLVRELRGGSPELRLLKSQLEASNEDHKLLLEGILRRMDDLMAEVRR